MTKEHLLYLISQLFNETDAKEKQRLKEVIRDYVKGV